MRPVTWATKEWLTERFSVIGATPKLVAKERACDEKTVRRWMRRHGVATRSLSEHAAWRQAHAGALDPAIYEVLDGELLGDGNLFSICRHTARYQHTAKHKLYLEWLSALMGDCGLPFGDVTQVDNNGREAWHVSSRKSWCLKKTFDRWYPEGKKIIPKDIVLTPRACLHWYLGDGGLSTTRSHPACVLATCCFHRSEIEATLLPQLSEFSPRLKQQKTLLGEEFGFCVVLDSSFLSFVGSCPGPIDSVYGYKWAVKPRRRVGRYCHERGKGHAERRQGSDRGTR